MNNEYRDIISFDGTPIKCLVRETGSNKWLIVTHGLGEHLGRHEFFLKLFSQNFNIAIYDLRGHGRSGGRRTWVNDFSEYSKDLNCVIEYLVKHFSLQSYVLFGHSMGGLITADFMQNHVREDLYPEKVFLSSPAVGAPGIMGPVFATAPKIIFEGLTKLPSIPLAKVLNLRKLSHDSRVYESYVKDEFTQLKIHLKLYMEIMKASREVFSRPLRIKCSLYCAIGTEDALVHPKLMIKYFTEVEKNAQLKVFEGGYHELHNEIEKYRKPYLNFLRQSLTGLAFE
jgi:alpha-beta hydrolase superfamily lysophospholipase